MKELADVGCALEVDVVAASEKLIAVRSKNQGQSGIDVTVIFLAGPERKYTIPECKRKFIMV